MTTNLDRYKNDLEKLILFGNGLHLSLKKLYDPKGLEKIMKEDLGDDAKKIISNLPSFTYKYQVWYSEAQALIKQLLPDRLLDFKRYYEAPQGRKEITPSTYRIEDCLQGIYVEIGSNHEKLVYFDAAIPLFRQQRAILDSVKSRFESSLFDIRQLVQADLFDTELEAATELNKQKFTRAAGALAGVVLERHLRLVCANHNINLSKKNPSISDLNVALKNSEIIDIVQWRSVQHLGDIRNLCDHDKEIEPTTDQVDDLISGTLKIIKTMF